MEQKERSWTFFSNHGHIYLLLAGMGDMTVREIANKVGITERSALSIIQDLEEADYIRREKVGRSNRYKILAKKTLRHPLESNVQLKELVELVQRSSK